MIFEKLSYADGSKIASFWLEVDAETTRTGPQYHINMSITNLVLACVGLILEMCRRASALNVEQRLASLNLVGKHRIS